MLVCLWISHVGREGKDYFILFIYFILFFQVQVCNNAYEKRMRWRISGVAAERLDFSRTCDFLKCDLSVSFILVFFFVWVCVSFYLFQQIINLNFLRFAGISLFRLTTFLGFVQMRMNVSSKKLFECDQIPNLGSTPGGWSLC